MPVNDLCRIVAMNGGGTPLIDLTRLMPRAKKFLVKYEAANPTGSFKDRGSSLKITKAIIRGGKRVVIASTGNGGSSVAALAAFARLGCKIILPEIVAPAKIAQMKAYGAEIELTSGDYADAMDIAENQVRGDPESFLAGGRTAQAPGRIGGQFQGTGTINGDGLYTFRVQAKDNGEPGADTDHFDIKIWNGTDTEADPYHKAKNTISGGNIQVQTN